MLGSTVPFWPPAWLQSGFGKNLELLERLVAVRLKAELNDIRTDSSDYWRDM